MGKWSVIVPEITDITSLVINPRLELDTTNYAGVGGTIVRTADRQRRGTYSLEVQPGAGANNGAYYGPIALTSGQSYTFSCDFFGQPNVPYRIYFGTTAGVVKGTPTTFTPTTTAWRRVSVTWQADATTDFRLYFVKNNDASAAYFWVDGVMCVNLTYDVTYIDGDEGGSYWTAQPNNSTSVRRSSSRAGGREYDLEAANLYVEVMDGAGMPPLETHLQQIAAQDGANYQGGRAGVRTLVMTGLVTATSGLFDLHDQRKGILNYLKPDVVKDRQPFTLRYYGNSATKPLEITAVLDGEAGPIEQTHYQKIALRFICPDPYFYEDGNEGSLITSTTSIVDADYIMRRVGGTWYNISTAFNGEVRALALGINGEIYIGGSFTNVGDANGDYILMYTPATGALSSLGTGANGSVHALVVAPNGNLYAGGGFTSMGGVANTGRIARWNGSTWNAVGTGIASGDVRALVFGRDGTLYAGGGFTDHVDANGDYISKWNGSAWSSLSTGLNGICYALEVAPNGDIYLGGAFTTAGGTTVNRVAKWNGTAFSALGSGTNGDVYALATAANGDIYVGGDFTTAGGASISYIAKWNGSRWEALGSGVNGVVYTVEIDVNGLVYVGGALTAAGGLTLATRMAIWNGSSWAHIPLALPSTPFVQDFLFLEDDLYLGYSTAGTATGSYLNTLTNTGTRESFPKMHFNRSGGTSATVAYIKNETSGDTLWLDYALLDGETLEIDLTPEEERLESSYFGDVTGQALLRSSDLASFSLLPGINKISAYVIQVGSPSMIQWATWPVRYWSADE